MNRAQDRVLLTELLSDKIICQQLPAGRSVGETALADELGVSRTPIREALLRLEGEGMVRAVPGRGFIVQPLEASEARQIYPIVARLERLALESSERPGDAQIIRLRELNARLASADVPQERMRLDSAWHREVASGCSNPRLIRLIESVKRTMLRYEYAYLQKATLRDRSLPEHEGIVTLLAEDPARAGQAIEEHWKRGLSEVLALLEGGKS